MYKGEGTGCTGMKSASNLHPAGSSTQNEKTAELAEMQRLVSVANHNETMNINILNM